MNKRIKVICFLILCFWFAGCGNNQSEETVKELNTGFIPAKAGMYDSADTAMIKQINNQEKKITFYNFGREKNYTLTFDGTAKLYDK